MEERIARLKTSQEAKIFAKNAQRLGHSDLEAQALERAAELQATEEGYISPAEQAIAAALYAYEDQQGQLKGRTFRANRTRQMFARHGALMAAERMVLSRQPSRGYEVLEDAGLQELSFEAIVDRFPQEFSRIAVEASRARLEGRSRALSPSDATDIDRLSDSSAGQGHNLAVMDSDALALLEGFRDPTTRFHARWLPLYRESVLAIEAALEKARPEDVFELIWKRAENHISNAGQGMLKFEIVDSMRDELNQVVLEIHQDGSPDCFDRIVERFENWKTEGRIPIVPRLLIARAFAGVHPSRYHTTVDSNSQSEVLAWFVAHTGFVFQKASNWAERAHALTTHLDRSAAFTEDCLTRNIFPWFVIEQIRARSGVIDVAPGHIPRPVSALANLPPARRFIQLRHNALQTELFRRLALVHGAENVWTEYPTGTGGFADAIVRVPDHGIMLYEIKIASTAAGVVRQAMGQLLEYGYRDGGIEPTDLFIVGEPQLDDSTRSFIARLRAEFNLKIEYMQVDLPAEDQLPE